MRLIDEYREARDLEGNLVPLTWHTLGSLAITSGRVLTCDPLILTDNDVAPLPFALEAGRYPVYAATAPIRGWGERVALMVVLLRDQEVDRWQEWDAATRYAVDSGIACIVDVDAARKVIENGQVDEEYGVNMLTMMREQSPSGRWMSAVLDPATGANMIAVRPGLGDNTYATRAGYGAHQEVACLLMDYHIIDLPGITEPE
jgi:hypothetical protein